MSTDEEPHKRVVIEHSNGSVIFRDACRPKVSDFLEVQ
jgi:hypothetical protein